MDSNEVINDPIFIGGDGRSGTTLLNVILDSHPGLSVAPEYHFNGGSDLGTTALEAVRIKQDGGLLESGVRAVDTPEWKPSIQFVNRVMRAGLTLEEIAEAISSSMLETGTNLVDFEDRCKLIEKFGGILSKRHSKKRWGMKIMREIRSPGRYAKVWDEAQFIHIIRDGRDVAASQLMGHGNWGYGDIEEAARNWQNIILQSRRNSSELSYTEVRYEDIVTKPEETLKDLCKFLKIRWSKRLLNHEKQKHDFYDTKIAHPSREASKKEINSSAVGRFKRDLNEEQIELFNSIAGEMLESLGY
tara:strand:+ start:22 stop:927 length:906 start_codon:yes stop_codon:yes gene_type:complete